MLNGKSAGETDAVTMSAIKNLLAEHQEEFDVLHSTRERAPAPPELHGETAVSVGAPAEAEEPAQAVQPQNAERRSVTLSGLLNSFSAWLTTQRLITAAVVLLFLLHPVLTTVLLLGWFVGAAALFTLVGSDRIWGAVSRGADRWNRMFPHHGTTLYRWLDSVAVRWDAALDLLPDGSVDTLYMPNFAHYQDMQRERDAAYEAAVDARYAALREQA